MGDAIFQCSNNWELKRVCYPFHYVLIDWGSLGDLGRGYETDAGRVIQPARNVSTCLKIYKKATNNGDPALADDQTQYSGFST